VASHDAKCHEVVGRPTIRVRGRSDFLEDVLEDALGDVLEDVVSARAHGSSKIVWSTGAAP